METDGTAVLTRPSSRATRAFLFSDLRGYTRFVETRGDDAAAQLLAHYRSLVRTELLTFGGQEINTEGDSFFLVFVSPTAALDMAVAVQLAAAGHNREHADSRIDLGMGLHVGETVADERGFVGGAVNVASRLASQAGVGEILVSDTVRALVRTGGRHRFIDRGPLRLKGVTEPIRAWAVDWGVTPSEGVARAPALARPPPAGDRALVCPVLVGREAELARLAGALDAAALGTGDMVSIAGEAGVGKSALVRALVDVAVERGVDIVSGEALETDRGLSYAPFLSAMRARTRSAALDGLRETVDRLAPEIVPLFPEISGAASSPSVLLRVERDRYRVGLWRLVTGLAREAQVLLVLEDLHWADESSLDVLALLARAAPGHRLLIVTTHRSDELTRRHPLRRVLADLRRQRAVSELTLEPLGRELTREMIRAVLAQADPSVEISDDFLDAIRDRSEGNPFFTEEIIKALVARGDIANVESHWRRVTAAQPLRVPTSIRDAVEARLERLTEGSRRELGAAAVLGMTVPTRLLARMVETVELDLEDNLRAWLDEQLIVEIDDPTAPAFAFRHALTREVVYEQLLVTERLRLHRRAAEVLAEDPLIPPSTLAEHWMAGGQRDRAAETFGLAADRALSVGATPEALRHVDRAITARGHVEVDDLIRKARAYLAFDFTRARDSAAEGLRLAAPDDVEARVRLVHLLGTATWHHGNLSEEARLADTALGLVSGRSEDELTAEAYQWYAQVKMHLDLDDEAVTWADRAIVLGRQLGLKELEVDVTITKAAALGLIDPVGSLSLLDAAESIAERIGAIDALSRTLYNGVVTAFYAGSTADRQARVRRALRFADRFGYQARQMYSMRAYNDFVIGAWPEEGSFGIDGDFRTDWNLAWTRLAEGVTDAARVGPSADTTARFREIVDWDLASGPSTASSIPLCAVLGLLYAWAGDVERAHEVAAVLRNVAVGKPTPGFFLATHAGGFTASRPLFVYTRDRAALVMMATALEAVTGYDGERDMCLAAVAGIDGKQADVAGHLERALSGYRFRGIWASAAVDLDALSTVAPYARRLEPVISEVAAVLDGARAQWLLARLRNWQSGRPSAS